MELQTPNNKLNNTQDSLAEAKKFLFEVLRFWPLVLVSVLIALGWAWYENKYTPRIYPVAMTILVKENSGQENSAAMLYQNALIKSPTNAYNEPILLKADPLMQKVVEKLGFHIRFFLEGNIRTTEIYPGLPIEINAAEGGGLPYGRYWIQLISPQHFYLTPKTEEVPVFSGNENLYAFGDQVRIGNHVFSVTKKQGFAYQPFYNQPFFLQLSSSAGTGASYGGRLNVSWVEKGAAVLKLAITGETPEKEIDFLNTLARTYIEQDLEIKNLNASRTISFIGEQLGQISDSLSLIERELQQFKENNVNAGLSGESSRMYGQLQELVAEQTQLQIQRQYYNYLQEYLQEEGGKGELVVPSALGISDPVMNTLIAEMVSLQLQQEELKRNTRPDNPFVQQIAERLSDLRRNILENLATQKGSLRITEKSLQQRMNRIEGEVKKLPRAEREYVNIRRTYSLSEGLFNFLMEKQAEASISQASAVPDISIVNPAKQVGGALTPDTKKNYTMALLFGLGLPLGFIFLKNYLNNKVQDKEQIARFTNMPLLGVVGHKGKSDNLIVINRPKSAVSEAFRSIRSNLQFFGGNGEKEKKVYLITSSISGEGKTFCSINLATVFAYSGKKTLLLGADLRKPKIWQDFELSNETGLSNYLAMKAPLEEIIQSTKVQNLDLISGGITPPNPSELLMSRKMQELMEELEKRYDVIIIDTPPIGLVTDALVLMPYAEHSVFVVRQNYTPTDLIKNAQELYLAGKITNISILFNDLKAHGKSYGYGYGYGYGYYEDKEERKGLFAKLFRRN